MKSNSNRVALITGAARRIGAIIARHLHANGFNVIIHYRHSQNEATTLAETLNAIRSHSAITAEADLDQPDQYQQLIDTSVAEWGRLDVLVNSLFFLLQSASIYMGIITLCMHQ